MRLRHVVVVFAVMGLVLAGCAKEGNLGAKTLDIVATDYRFEGAPQTISGGVLDVSFRNDGKADHELSFVQIGDTPIKTFAADINKLEDGGPFPSYLKRGAVAFEFEPGKSGTTRMVLPPGEYALSCTLTDAPGKGDKTVASHATLGMFQKVTVVEGDGELDAAGGEFVATDYTFAVPDSVEAGKQEYVFQNDSSKQWHHMILQKYGKGVTAEQAQDAFGKLLQAPQDAPPPTDIPMPEQQPAGLTGIFSPGLGQTVELDLEAGRTYVAVCFIQDVEGGPPHAIKHKMFKAFTVEG